MNGRKTSFRLSGWLLLCFTCSGMSGLIYEVSWVRLLELVFGSTTYAVATVLAVFMGGLALGSYAMGRTIRRFENYHPLGLYAGIEILIALAALAIPYLIQSFAPIQHSLLKIVGDSFVATTVLRFAMSGVVLLIPTFLMGATLPLVSELVARDPRFGRRSIGWLYSANTLGAVFGCALAGLVLFPVLGLTKTQWVAMCLNLLAAYGAWKLSRWSSEELVVNDGADQDDLVGTRLIYNTDTEPTLDDARSMVGIYAISGLVSMLYEVAWTRVLVLVLGSSVYAYTIMLMTFLLGIALGAWAGNRFVRNRCFIFHAAALAQIGIMLTTYLGVHLVEDLPWFYLQAYEFLPASSNALMATQFLFAFALMILPTIGLGAMFPITMLGLPAKEESAAGMVGWAYASNTLGAIGGSVLGGFFLVPWLGTQKTLLIGVGINAALAAWAISHIKRGALRRMRKPVAVGLLLTGAAVLVITPVWDPAIMSCGIFRYARKFVGSDHEQFRDRVHEATGEVLSFDEGLTCAVTVTRGRDLIRLSVNGKPDASVPSDLPNPFPAPGATTSDGDLGTQVLLGQIPLLLAPQRDDVLVIGFGSGVTVGSVLTHAVKKVDVVELESAVIRGSRFFEHFNRKPLQDPRTHLIVNDARNHLLVTENQYDVIISEPSNPWIPGAANLFTREFFELGKTRLRSDGTFCLWLQMYEIQSDHFEMLLRTFASVFPEVHLFRQGLDAILVGTTASRPIDVARMKSRWTGGVQEVLQSIHRTHPEDLLAHYWVGGQELRDQLQGTAFNTDDNRRIEFAAPLQVMVKRSGDDSSSVIARLFHEKSTGLIPHIKSPEFADKASFWLRLSEVAWQNRLYPDALRYGQRSLKLESSAEALRAVVLAMERTGQHDPALSLVDQYQKELPDSATVLQAKAELLSFAGKWSGVRKTAERWLQLNAADSRGRYFLAISSYHLKAPEEALQALEMLKSWLWEDKEYHDLPWYLGTLYWQYNRFDEAVPCLELYIQREPQHVQARLELIDALQRTGRESEAISHCLKLSQVSAAMGEQVLRSAVTSLQTGDFPVAAEQLERARRLKPWDSDIALRLAYTQEQQGNLKAATDTLETFLNKTPDRAAVVGYLSGLLAKQNQKERAQVLAARYRVLTGETWDAK